MSSQKGNTPLILIFAVVLILAGVGIYYFGIQKPNVVSQVVNSPQPIPTATASNQPASGKTSPNGTYTLEEQAIGDGQTITIKDAKGKAVFDDVISKNYQSIIQGTQKLGLKGWGQSNISFKSWVDDSSFVITIKTAEGSSFEAVINATTGVVDPSSFTRLK